MKKRLEMLGGPDDDDDPEFEFEEEFEEEETVSGTEAEDVSAVPASPETPAAVEPPSELDLKRIAEDEARGIRFSADKRVFEKYPQLDDVGDAITELEGSIEDGIKKMGDDIQGGCDSIVNAINEAISVCFGVIDGIKRICKGEAGTVEKIKF